MVPKGLDPTLFTALNSLHFGDVLSADGRAHPLDAHTPIVMVEIPATVVPPGVTTGPQVGPQPTGGATDPMSGAPVHAAGGGFGAALGFSWPEHFGARVAVGLLALGLLLIVAYRITNS